MTNIPLKPQNEKFTDKQWQAVFDQGDNLLISASAGSGKTTVLVRRVIEKLKDGCNIDELLIVTFTEAAAREMKERIRGALHAAINQEGEEIRRQHFTKQLQLLPIANIQTLHAFCLTVIRRFYYVIDLDPVFRMLTDETETLLLKEEVWLNLRDQYYEEDDQEFFKFVENFSNDRSDEGLSELILSLFDFARANPNPQQWLEQLAENYHLSQSLADNHLYQEQMKPAILADLATAGNLLQVAKENTKSDGLMAKAQSLVEFELQQATALQADFLADDLSSAYQKIDSLTFARYPAFRKEEQKVLSQEIKPLRDAAKELVEKVKNYFPYPPEEMMELMAKAEPIVAKMSEITQRFLMAFHERKISKGALDFNDLEHYTLAILQGDGNGSEASNYYRKKFKEVLVDEYQDVNRLQEAILKGVRIPDGQPGNLFMVGDVKQSIYSFRLADPTLFIEKYLAFAQNDGGRRIILAENFRSRREILDFTNLIFMQLMDEELGQIPYDEAAALQLGFPDFPVSDAYDTELLLYEKAVEEDASVIEDKTEGELHIVAMKIQELIASAFPIYDKEQKKTRSVTYNDIVLLTPTRKNNLAIIDVFKKFNLPLEVNDAQNYFQATEIQIMVSLLQIIDNPYQDIPLVAVLRSPIVGLLEDELAEIRLAQKNGDYFEALLAYSVQEDPLALRLRDFLTNFEKWREQARKLPIPQLLWMIYEDTAYLDYVAGMAAGQQRYANLIALIHRAEAYETSSFRGLYQFIRFIEKMQEKEKDLAEPLATPAEDAVRVMTVHASKGLEFPIVFLLDTTKSFNYQDFQKRFIFEEQYGAGIQYIDANESIKYDTLPYQAIKQVRLRKSLSEEMRKLYVALTRAEQKLFLVGSYKDRQTAYKLWQSALTQENVVLDAALRFSGRGNLLNWIGLALARHPAMSSYFTEEKPVKKSMIHPANFKIHWWNQEDIASYEQTVTQPETPKTQSQGKSDESLHKRLTYQYPYPKATQTTSYQSVSELKRIYNDPDDQEISRLEWTAATDKASRQNYRFVQDELAKPKFLQTTGTDQGAVGTATHRILQLLPLNQPPDAEFLEAFITALESKGILTNELASKIDREGIFWFYQTELGQLIVRDHQLVKREQPFSMLKEAQSIFSDFNEPDAELLIHGIIDGYIEFSDHIVLYDFKTDGVYGSLEQIATTMRQKYFGQLNLYAKALEQALGKKVKKKYLVLLQAKLIIDW